MDTDLITEFSKKYAVLKNTNFKHSNTTKIITDLIPSNLFTHLHLDRKEFIIKGSVGQGAWADIPWVAIMHKGVTTSTQNGYYIVLLFSKDMETVYLSLGLGWTQFREKFGVKIGRSKAASFGYMLSKHLKLKDDDFTEFINLGATSERGMGYEASNICTRKFKLENLYEDEFYDALEEYLEYYWVLMEEVGADIFFDVSDDFLKIEKDQETIDLETKIKKMSSSFEKGKALIELRKISDMLPPTKREYVTQRIMRNKAFADYVKARSKYICEICGRQPFIKKDGTPYAEADHVEPLYHFGVDHPDNMRCLCAQCHRVITFGSDEEIGKLEQQFAK